jgi:ribosomal protein S18 acetylase RimI-like enzyme
VIFSISKITPHDASRWQATLEIYREAFPEWEREPEDAITQRAIEGRYVIHGALNEQGTVIGFYLLDIVHNPNYACLCFLAVADRYQGRGIGTKLCRDAIARFHDEYRLDWLLIEAEERQAIFYSKLGFKRVDIPYNAPKFDETGSVPMHLMLISSGIDKKTIDGACLTEMIRHVFITGYKADNDCINQQVEQIPDQVQLLNWRQHNPA